MARIAYGESSRGVVSEFVQPDHSLDDLILPANALVLVLDSLEKPGNIGAVFRCADAAGVDAVILSVRPKNSSARRACRVVGRTLDD